MRFRFLFLIIGILNLPMTAQAQGENLYRVELFGGLGFSRLWDGEGILGNGPGVSASAAYFVRPNISLGVDLNRSDHSGVLPLQDVNRRSDGKTTFISFNGSYYLVDIDYNGRRITPFLTGGVGLALATRTNYIERWVRYPFAQPFLSRPAYVPEVISITRIGEQKPAFNAGTGVDVGLCCRLSARPEFRFFATPSQIAVRELVTLGFRW